MFVGEQTKKQERNFSVYQLRKSKNDYFIELKRERFVS